MYIYYIHSLYFFIKQNIFISINQESLPQNHHIHECEGTGALYNRDLNRLNASLFTAVKMQAGDE
mgnify:CR=1 FL=1|jgi:hypothetical protein